MPKCCKCGKPQAKLNKGGFCKACFKIKYNPEIIESVIKMTNSTDNIDESIDIDHDEAINDRCMINVIKQSMLTLQRLGGGLLGPHHQTFNWYVLTT